MEKSRDEPTSSSHQKNFLKGKRRKIDNKAHKTKEAMNLTGKQKKSSIKCEFTMGPPENP